MDHCSREKHGRTSHKLDTPARSNQRGPSIRSESAHPRGPDIPTNASKAPFSTKALQYTRGDKIVRTSFEPRTPSAHLNAEPLVPGFTRGRDLSGLPLAAFLSSTHMISYMLKQRLEHLKVLLQKHIENFLRGNSTSTGTARPITHGGRPSIARGREARPASVCYKQPARTTKETGSRWLIERTRS